MKGPQAELDIARTHSERVGSPELIQLGLDRFCPWENKMATKINTESKSGVIEGEMWIVRGANSKLL